MAWLMVILSEVFNTLKGLLSRYVSDQTVTIRDALAVTVLRLAMSFAIGMGVCLLKNDTQMVFFTGQTGLVVWISGISCAVNMVTWLFCMKRSCYMMPNVFGCLGLNLAPFLSYLCYGEPVTPWQIAAIILIVFSSGLMCSYSGTVRNKVTAGDVVLCSVMGLSCCVANFVFKMIAKVEEGPVISSEMFSAESYVIASVVILLVMIPMRIIDRKKETDGAKEKEKPLGRLFGKTMLYLVVMAMALFGAAVCRANGAKILDAGVMYPLLSGLSIVLSVVIGAVILKEKLNAKGIIAATLALIAMVMTNL